MRAVALADSVVQDKVAQSFVPLKVVVPQGTKEFPSIGNWPALRYWQQTYQLLGGEKCGGWFGISMVSPDLETEYAQPGSGLPWQLFESIAYDAQKFAAMLDRAAERAARERSIRADPALSPQERDRRLARFRAEVRDAVAKETALPLLPPKGFSFERAQELYKMAGEDLLVPGEPVVGAAK
jgi:hypothetical protein